MSSKIQKDLTDNDIDALFNNDNTEVLKQKDQTDLEVPSELSIENKELTNHIDRPDNQDSKETKIKKEKQKIIEKNLEIIEKDINEVKQLSSFEQAKLYIKKIFEYKKYEQEKDGITKNILSGGTKINVDNGTQCKFHIYRPKHIMGDIIYCHCKYCSVMKEFTQSEWDEYCIKYRKWF